LKLVKGQLARVEILIHNSSAPFSPILFLLKIRNEKFQKPKKDLKNNFKSNENIIIFNINLNKLFSLGVAT
jgi:hypothetical protein